MIFFSSTGASVFQVFGEDYTVETGQRDFCPVTKTAISGLVTDQN